ncbi:MAG: hypothetical protein JRF72_06725 [Deltaproteobacteria bacterium]|jgi:hypothetical protein|nr:hypothetical protein [Deltaproteobacteria bacterium]
MKARSFFTEIGPELALYRAYDNPIIYDVMGSIKRVSGKPAAASATASAAAGR